MKIPLLLLLLFCLFISCQRQKEAQRPIVKNPLYELAFDYKDSGKLDSAFSLFNKAKPVFLKQKDSLGVGKCLLNMALISSKRSDYFSSQTLSLEAIPYFNAKNQDHHIYIKSNFNSLGYASEQLANYGQSISFYKKSLLYPSDIGATLTVKNNIANVYRKMKNYDKAIAIYNEIINQKAVQDAEFAKFLSNLNYAKWLQNSNYKAAPNLLKALYIRQQENDLEGQNASYAHLSDYYAKYRPDSALFYAAKMYQAAQKNNSPFDQIQALQKLIKFSPNNIVKRYFERYRALDDSLQLSRNKSKDQFAIIRYESEKSKADNLILQKENTAKEYQIIKREVIIIIVIALIIIGSLSVFFWYKKRKENMLLASQKAIKENQLKTSKKVHDVVANGLYRVMAEIENEAHFDKEDLLDKIEELYEKSRDISYEETTINSENFEEKIAHLIRSFATANTKILLVGNTADLWLNINAKAKFEIEHVLQELMVNMKKHSKANNVVCKFEQTTQLLNIFYIDNGVGMPKGINFKNGLTNTGNRIDSINGEITFDTEVEKGLRIKISVPFS